MAQKICFSLAPTTSLTNIRDKNSLLPLRIWLIYEYMSGRIRPFLSVQCRFSSISAHTWCQVDSGTVLGNTKNASEVVGNNSKMSGNRSINNLDRGDNTNFSLCISAKVIIAPTYPTYLQIHLTRIWPFRPSNTIFGHNSTYPASFIFINYSWKRQKCVRNSRKHVRNVRKRIPK